MAKVYMMCGKICSGKSTHARQLREQYHAVILSVDEIMLALFGQDAGDLHDTYVERAKTYLYEKSVEIVRTGASVVLDWGFWTAQEREYARAFYAEKNIESELHYIDIDADEWARRLQKRNGDVIAKKTGAYYVDDGLAAKFAAIFEAPHAEEIDVRIKA